MKRVICLYRVSTIGQVDHDDIPMQKLACREYAATHPDWEIVDEISEKGVSGYKVSTNARDAIVEIKKRAITHQFDVLLVFMFDRLGRRDDETPFVVQWFVQQGIEVWSTREGYGKQSVNGDGYQKYAEEIPLHKEACGLYVDQIAELIMNEYSSLIRSLRRYSSCSFLRFSSSCRRLIYPDNLLVSSHRVP